MERNENELGGDVKEGENLNDDEKIQNLNDGSINKRIKRIAQFLFLLIAIVIAIQMKTIPFSNKVNSMNSEKPEHHFPVRYRVKERVIPFWSFYPFQRFSVENEADKEIAIIQESVWSWIYEFFGAGYESMYAKDGTFIANIRFNIFKKYFLFGSRMCYIREGKNRLIMTGSQESFFNSLWSGRRPKFEAYNSSGIHLFSSQTHLVENNRKWEIREARHGSLAAKMEEFITIDIWDRHYRGWNIEIVNGSLIDNHLPALFAGIDLGATVMKLKNSQQVSKPKNSRSNEKGEKHIDAIPLRTSDNAFANLEKRVIELEKQVSMCLERCSNVNSKKDDLSHSLEDLK